MLYNIICGCRIQGAAARGILLRFCFNLPNRPPVCLVFYGDYDKYPLIIPHADDTMKIIDCTVCCCGLQKTVVNTNMEFKKSRGMAVSIFDYFTSKATDEPERKQFSPTPYRKLAAALSQAGEDAKARYPDGGETIDAFVKTLKEICKTRCKRTPDADPQPLKAAAQFFLSADRMSAYACLLPPENDGAGITLEEFLEEMHREGINCGILQQDIQREIECGYLRIFPIARGTLPKAGENGKVTELFQRCEKVCLDAQADGLVDFIQDIQMQPIGKGTAICTIQPPVEGTNGSDVTGRVLPCPRAEGACIPQGENTAVSGDGQALTASADGILYIKDGLFCVQEQTLIDGDLGPLQEPWKVSGDLYVQGSVDGGAVIVATGNIVITGKVGQARITSVDGTIRVQQGIYGTDGGTFLSAARQVQAPVVEQAEISAGVSVVAEAIVNSTVHCDGTVYAMAGRGLITGSLIRAGDSILCLHVGNPAGDRNRFSVGYPPHSPESWKQLKTELAETKSTIKKLLANIANLRQRGSRISDMEKSVLERLVEQWNLYVEKQASLTAELRILDELLRKKSNGRVQCQTLHPLLEVQIGKLAQKITTEEENCNIHAVDSWIFLR